MTKFARLLVLLAVIQCLALACQALDLGRSLSGIFGRGDDEHEDKKKIEELADAYKWADDSLIADKKGKSNKVSKLLRFIHQKAGDKVYENKNATSAHTEDVVHKELADLSDEKVIETVCGDKRGKTCKYAVKTALKMTKEEKAIIAKALRHRPHHVDPIKLLYHKLFESAIVQAETKKIDETIDKGINLLATKSPYGWAATRALDLATKG